MRIDHRVRPSTSFQFISQRTTFSPPTCVFSGLFLQLDDDTAPSVASHTAAFLLGRKGKHPREAEGPRTPSKL